MLLKVSNYAISKQTHQIYFIQQKFLLQLTTSVTTSVIAVVVNQFNCKDTFTFLCKVSSVNLLKDINTDQLSLLTVIIYFQLFLIYT